MIGVTQLLSRPLATIPNTQSNPYTSFADVASNESTNGFYYLNDGTRTRRYYFCVDGSECGNSSGAWARIDATWASLGGERATATGYPIFNNDGTMGITCLNGGGGYSSNHGGARVSSNTPFKMKRFIISNLSLTSNGTWGGVTFPNTRIYIHTDATQTWAMTNPAADHYPGWFPQTGTGDLANSGGSGEAVYLLQSSTPPTSTVNISQSNNPYGFAQGIVYNIPSSFHNDDLIWMVGQGSYSSGANRPASMKIWFQHD